MSEQATSYVLMAKNFCGWHSPVGVYLDKTLAEEAKTIALIQAKKEKLSYRFYIYEVPFNSYDLRMPGL